MHLDVLMYGLGSVISTPSTLRGWVCGLEDVDVGMKWSMLVLCNKSFEYLDWLINKDPSFRYWIYRPRK